VNTRISLRLLAAGILGILDLAGCVKTASPPPVTYSDGAPHPLPPVQRERAFDGSLFAPGELGDLASDKIALSPGDPVIIRFGLKNGYPGIPQGRVTRLSGQVIRVEPSGSLLVSAQRTVRDSSGIRRVVLVGRVDHGLIETGNEVPVSRISMLRFRSEGPSDGKKRPNFTPSALPGKTAVRAGGQRKKGTGRTP
jgi:hypothetical protein